MINLLACYEKTYNQKHLWFIYFFSACIFMIIIAILSWDIFLQQQVKDANSKNYITEQKFNMINSKITAVKKSHADDMHIISILNQLQRHNSSPAAMLHELVIITPSGLYLTEINKDKLHIILKGNFQSYEDLNKFITNIRNSKFLKNPVLSEIKTMTGKRISHFVLHCNF